jgi:hypothetical protein
MKSFTGNNNKQKKIEIDSSSIPEALHLIRTARTKLRKAEVIRHEKAIHCELAEWLMAEYLGGQRAISGNQKGWDIELKDGKRIQIKSHAKALTNPSNWTTLSKHSEGVSEVYVIIFSPDYFIDEIFRVGVEEAYGMCNSKREITWRKLRTADKAIELIKFKKKFPFLFE